MTPRLHGHLGMGAIVGAIAGVFRSPEKADLARRVAERFAAPNVTASALWPPPPPSIRRQRRLARKRAQRRADARLSRRAAKQKARNRIRSVMQAASRRANR